MGKKRSNGGIAGGCGCFLKPSKSLLHGWTSPRTTSGPQVAGKQSRRRARPASALGPHTGSQLLSSTLGTSIHTSLLPTAWLFPSATACMEHRWYRRESCAHRTEGRSSLDRRATSEWQDQASQSCSQAVLGQHPHGSKFQHFICSTVNFGNANVAAPANKEISSLAFFIIAHF